MMESPRSPPGFSESDGQFILARISGTLGLAAERHFPRVRFASCGFSPDAKT